MNPLQRMELHKADFTQNDQIIYDCIMKNPAGITHMSTSSLAELCGVSQPALSRFVKGLGYARYQDFRAELIGMVAQQKIIKLLNLKRKKFIFNKNIPMYNHIDYT